MRTTQLLLAQAALTSAAAIVRDVDSHKSRRDVFNDFGTDSAGFQGESWFEDTIFIRDAPEDVDSRELAERAIRDVKTQQTHGSPTSHDHTCVVLRSLEWLAYNLIDETEKISAECGSHIYNEPARQHGHLALVLRGVMIWIQQLDFLKDHLETAQHWGLDSQLAAGKCYLDYSFQTAAWLKAMEAQACDFSQSNAARCLTFDKIQALYLANRHVAALMHGDDHSVNELVSGYFPKDLDAFWTSQDEKPKPGSSISAYIRRHDLSLNPQVGQFPETQKVWTCSDSWDQGPCNECKPTHQKNDSGKKKAGKAGKTGPSKPRPVETVPVGKAPVDKAPTNKVPAGDVPTDKVPAGKAPADELPTDKVPGNKAPVDTPADKAPSDVPTNKAPTDVPTEKAPIDTPADKTPIDTPKNKVPIGKAPTDEIPTDKVPTGAPSDKVPAENTPTGQSPADKVPTDEAPTTVPVVTVPVDFLTEKPSAEKAPIKKSPVNGFPVQKAPAQAAPVQDQPLKSLNEDAAPAEAQVNKTLAADTKPADNVPVGINPEETQAAKEQPTGVQKLRSFTDDVDEDGRILGFY